MPGFKRSRCVTKESITISDLKTQPNNDTCFLKTKLKNLLNKKKNNQKKSSLFGKSVKSTAELKFEASELQSKSQCCNEENQSNSTEMTDLVGVAEDQLADEVYDGTTCNSQFADFIYGADEEDEEAERAETEYWAGCQGLDS